MFLGKKTENRKSRWLFGFLLMGSFLQWLIFDLSTGTLLLFFLTFLTFFHLFFKSFQQKYPDSKVLNLLRKSYRIFLLSMGFLSIFILVLVSIPQFSCSKVNLKMLEASDYVIVLGAGLNGKEVSERLKLRLDKALEVTILKPEINIIVSGGQGANEVISEAAAMGNYLVEKGFPKNQIFYEDQSTSTYENLLNSQNLLNPLNSRAQVMLVSSDFHIFRALMIAENLGLKSGAVCSPSEWYVKSNYMIREIPATINDFLRITF